MTIAEQIRKKSKSIYQQLAEKHGVSANYVNKIANAKRTPTKKVGLEILNDLKKLANN